MAFIRSIIRGSMPRGRDAQYFDLFKTISKEERLLKEKANLTARFNNINKQLLELAWEKEEIKRELNLEIVKRKYSKREKMETICY